MPKQATTIPALADARQLVADALDATGWDIGQASERAADAAWQDPDGTALYELAVRGASDIARNMLRQTRKIAPGEGAAPAGPVEVGPGGQPGRLAAALEGWRGWRLSYTGNGHKLLSEATAPEIDREAAHFEKHAEGALVNARFLRAVEKALKKAKVTTPADLPDGVMDKIVAEYKS